MRLSLSLSLERERERDMVVNDLSRLIEEIWPYGGSAVCVTGMRRKIRASRASPTACAVDVNHNPSSAFTATTTRLIVLLFDADHDQ